MMSFGNKPVIFAQNHYDADALSKSNCLTRTQSGFAVSAVWPCEQPHHKAA
jgi:hypothetical protein